MVRRLLFTWLPKNSETFQRNRALCTVIYPWLQQLLVTTTAEQFVIVGWRLIICCNTCALGLVFNSFMVSCERWSFQVRSYNVRSNLWLVTEAAHMSRLIDEWWLSVASHGVWQQKRDPQFDRTRLVHCRIKTSMAKQSERAIDFPISMALST